MEFSSKAMVTGNGDIVCVWLSDNRRERQSASGDFWAVDENAADPEIAISKSLVA